MNNKLFEALEALCLMWSQYCDGPGGHMFMSAGEEAMEVLEKYNLLKNVTPCAGEIDEERLEELRKSIIN